MKIHYNKISLFSVIVALLTNGVTYATNSNVDLSLSIGTPPAEEGSTSVIFEIPGNPDVKTSVTESKDNIKEYKAFPWKSLQDITLKASALDIDIKGGDCSDSVPSFVNKKGQLIDSIGLTLKFGTPKKDSSQISCYMKGTYKNTGTVSLSAKLSADKSREVSFTINNAPKNYSLSSNSTILSNDYLMSALLNPIPISTKKTIGTAKGECPAITNFTKGAQILTAVTYEISYSLKNGLSCTATTTWQDIP